MSKKIVYSLFITICVLSGCKSNKVEQKLTPHQMIKNNLIDAAKGQFQMLSDINGIDHDGNTVLHLAAERNDEDLCTYFIIKGADAELKNFNSETALHVAIKNGSFDAAKAIISAVPECLYAMNADGVTALDYGFKVDPSYYDIFITKKTSELRDTEGQGLVHYFVKTRNLKAINSCIRKNFPLSVKDKDGKTPLDLAFEDINDDTTVQIVAALIMAGAEDDDVDYDYFANAVVARNLDLRFEDGQTALHIASIYGHESIVNYLLVNNAVTSVQDSSGATPLHEAVRYGNLDIAKLLLSAGADVNAKDNLGKTPIMLILPKDKINETYELLIKYRADLKQKDMYGDTVLHTAAMMRIDTGLMAMLLSNGADINERNKEGVTPLSIAVQNEDLPIVQLLASNGANLHTKDTNGKSPLSVGLEGSNELVEVLINRKNVISQDSAGNTPLHIALLNDASLTKVKYIISLTDDVNIRNADGNSALFISILKNRQQVGELLLAKNADIFSTNTNNNSPLRLALKYGGDVQRWLITPKTVQTTDGSGNTALHYAAEWQYANSINFLLDKGCDINAKNANGETALFNAVRTNNPEIIQLMINGGADIHERDNLGSTALHAAARWSAPKSITELINLGININAQNSNGKTALSEAVVSGKADVVKQLLDYGANPNSCDTDGVTVIMESIKVCNRDMVRTLLYYGANSNIQDINGRNAYHEAAYVGNISIINMIRETGVNPLARDKQGRTPFSLVINKDIETIKAVLGESYNITDTDGNTPIHIVVKSKASKLLLQTLIDEGYPVDIRNADGYTALNYAIESDDLATALLLLENGADPFQMIDRKGRNGVSIALEKNDSKMIENIVRYAGNKTDVQGNTILHYAAKTCPVETVRTLISYGLDKQVKNIAGETPYVIAQRWKRLEIADLLKK